MRITTGLIGTASLALMLAACDVPEQRREDALAAAGGVEPAPSPTPEPCPATGAALQVLGSGGPIAEAARAGTSYLLWIDGEPRLLIDAGAGSFLRFAEAGASIASLDAILLTHLHADHAGDLAGVLNSGGFEGRTQPLAVIGPDAAPRFPGTGEFLERLLSKESGAFAYNGGYLDGTENKPLLEAQDITTAEGTAEATVLDVSGEYSVTAYPVHHGPVPALGYAVEIGGASFVITGDQSALSQTFLEGLRGSQPTILFAHHVINGEQGQPRGLHRTPAEIGQLAGALNPSRLLLTHNMERSLSRIEDSRAAIATSYEGAVDVTQDLECFALGDEAR
ncbi:Arylsulfatase [Erythrobacter sp. NAP1]|uniref:MBL fold metallo-hydrolase n=1 Tax=Erythrobacter sp. NAP1 TaxID=237727 RepID=UPI00006876B6|nr:MBL fold metallo-hydrolase [Erythrobacter sp. NAP1]EAQ28807.1 Arylsulfatase [Erythrobacter sp. NAP1]